MREFRVLDTVGWEPCPDCGCKVSIIDGDDEGKFWLLCLSLNGADCVKTRDLPSDIRITE